MPTVQNFSFNFTTCEKLNIVAFHCATVATVLSLFERHILLASIYLCNPRSLVICQSCGTLIVLPVPYVSLLSWLNAWDYCVCGVIPLCNAAEPLCTPPHRRLAAVAERITHVVILINGVLWEGLYPWNSLMDSVKLLWHAKVCG